MSRNHDNSSYHDQRGRSNERSSSHYSSSRSDSRSQYPRQRHQQTSQGWQNGNYNYQPNSYNSNYQYQNRPRPNRPGSTYSHSTTWNQPWGGHNSQFQSTQWGGQPNQPLSTPSFNPHCPPPSYETTKTSHPNKPTSSTSENPPPSSKEQHENTPETTTVPMKKVHQESRAKSPSRPRSRPNLDGDNDNFVDRVNLPRETLGTNRSGPKHRISLIKNVLDADDGNSSEGTKQMRRSSSDSNSCGNSTITDPSKSSTGTLVNRRSRSSSCSSTKNASSANKHGLQSPGTNKGQTSKEVQAAKQRVIKELLGMNRVKLKELVTYPRSRKIDMVMKYMIKESRAQHSHKQRQLAQAGIEGTHSESSNTLEPQDVEALLSDPDLHISLSNLPTEMIETLGNVFKLNSQDHDESGDQGLVLGDLTTGVQSGICLGQSQVGIMDVANDMCRADVDLDCQIKSELNIDDDEILKDVVGLKPVIDLCSSNQTSSDLYEFKHTDVFSHDITNTLDSVEASSSKPMQILLETETDDHKDVQDNLNKIPIGLQSLESSSLELTAALQKSLGKPELLEGVGLSPSLSVDPNSISLLSTEPDDGILIDSICKNTCSITHESKNGNVMPPTQMDESSPFPEPAQNIDYDSKSHGITENNALEADSVECVANSSCLDISSQQIIATPELNPIDTCKTTSKHVGGSVPSSLASDDFEKCISLSESKANATFEVVSKHGSVDLDVDQYQKIDGPMVSETLEHKLAEPISMQPGDPVAEGSDLSKLVEVNDQETVSILKFANITTKNSCPNDIVSILPVSTCLEKNSDTSVLTAPVTVDETNSVENVLKMVQNISSEKEVMSESIKQTSLDLERKSLSPEPVVMEKKLSDQMDVDKDSAALDKTDLFEVGRHSGRPMDPMCILYESLDLVMGSKLAKPQKLGTGGEYDRVGVLDLATESVPIVSDPDCGDLGPSRVGSRAAKLKNPISQGCEILPEMEHIQVKSEQEENDTQTFQGHTLPSLGIPQPILGPGSEVSTQTEHFSNTETSLSDMLQLFKASCENSSQKAAFDQLSKLFMTKAIDPINDDNHTRTRRRQLKSVQQTKPQSSQCHAPTKNLKRPATTSTSAQDIGSNLCGIDLPNNLSDPILLDATIPCANEEHLPIGLDTTTSEDEMTSQEKLKSLFFFFSLIEKKIETWMEIKKKLYEKVNNILEDEKTQSSSSSEQRDLRRPVRRPVIELSSSSSKRSVESVSTLSNERSQNKVSTTKARKEDDALHSPTTLPRETRRGMKQPPAYFEKPAELIGNVDSRCVSQSKVKEELLSSSNTDDGPQLSKSKSKRKRRFHPKRKVNNSRVASNTSNNSKPVTLTPPSLKRSSRNKTNLDEKMDQDMAMATTTSEESDSRCSRRKVNQEPLVAGTNKADESLYKGTRRRHEKELLVVSNEPECNTLRSNRRTRQCQGSETNEESVELCILPPSVSRRTKGERKEILVPTDFLNIPSGADDITSPKRASSRHSVICEPLADNEPSPRRARPTRQSICEPLTDDELSPRRARPSKQSICEPLTDDELSSRRARPSKQSICEPLTDDERTLRRATRQSFSEPQPHITQELIPLEVKRVLKRKACDVENTDDPPSVKLKLLNVDLMRHCSVMLEPLVLHPNKKTESSTLADHSTHSLKEQSESSESGQQPESQMADTNLDTDVTSDDDDLPLLKIKQKTFLNVKAESSVTKFINDADQHSVSSSDTVLDQGTDDPESGQSKSKRNKTKRTKKDKQYDHHSKNEHLEFVDHSRGTILDIKIVGRHLLAASEDGFLYSYSMKSGKLKKRYEGHQAAVTCLCTIDGEKESEKSCPEKVVTGSLDDHVRCFLFKTAELIHAPIKIGTALCVDYNWGIIYLGTKLGEVAKVNAKNFSLIGEHMKFSSESILALKATKEGPRKVLIIGTRDQPIAIRDADTGLFLRTVSGAWHHTVCSLLLDKSLVYCGTMSGPIPVFDFTNGQEVFRLHAGVGVRCVKIYSNLLFAGCYDGNIYIFNVKDHSLVQTISGSGKMVLCLDITKNKVIYSCKDALKSINFPPEVSKALKDAKLK